MYFSQVIPYHGKFGIYWWVAPICSVDQIIFGSSSLEPNIISFTFVMEIFTIKSYTAFIFNELVFCF